MLQETASPKSRNMNWAVLAWMGLGWAIAWLVGWTIFEILDGTGMFLAELKRDVAAAGALSVFITGALVHKKKALKSWSAIMRLMLGGTIGWALGLFLGMYIGQDVQRAVVTPALLSATAHEIDWFIGNAIFALTSGAVAGISGGLAIGVVLWKERALPGWPSVIWAALGWLLGSAIGVTSGWVLVPFIFSVLSPDSLMWSTWGELEVCSAVMGAVMGLIGGSVVAWQVQHANPGMAQEHSHNH